MEDENIIKKKEVVVTNEDVSFETIRMQNKNNMIIEWTKKKHCVIVFSSPFKNTLW